MRLWRNCRPSKYPRPRHAAGIPERIGGKARATVRRGMALRPLREIPFLANGVGEALRQEDERGDAGDIPDDLHERQTLASLRLDVNHVPVL